MWLLLSCLALSVSLRGQTAAWLFSTVGPQQPQHQEKFLGLWETDRAANEVTDNLLQEEETPPWDEHIDEDNPPNPPREMIILTFPGTLWCGPGNIALNYHDLGLFNQTDACCRRHDLCGDIITAGEDKHNLSNKDFYTKLNCRCDLRFHQCLRRSTDGVGDTIGKLYFNAIGTQCFRSDFPILRCLKFRGILRPKCVEYQLDHTQHKKYQWFDVPPY